MRNISLVHELETLGQGLSRVVRSGYASDQVTRKAHFADLYEESYKLAIRPEMRLVKWAKEWHDNQSLIGGVGEFKDF